MKIAIKKFKRVEGVTLSIPATIEGGNGVGKTTILEAIAFVLTGKGLDGKEFAEIYDNRLELSEAYADVTYFDAYGNSFRRLVRPVFQTNRQGEEKLSILRSTKCFKNEIEVNDFANEFEDFYKFGTDFFFNQKEQEQRTIFIDLMKSLLPEFDVNEAQAKLKEFEKAQRNTVKEIQNTRAMLKELQYVEVSEIYEGLQQQEKEYQKFAKSLTENQELISEINKRNNEAISAFEAKRRELSSELIRLEGKEQRGAEKVGELKMEVEKLRQRKYEGIPMIDVSIFEAKKAKLEEESGITPYFESLEDFAKSVNVLDPILAKNIKKINELRGAELHSLPSWVEATDVCPTCGTISEDFLEKTVFFAIEKLKEENKGILQRLMSEANAKALALKSEIERNEYQLNELNAQNKSSEKSNKENERRFETDKFAKISTYETEMKQVGDSLKAIYSEIKKVKKEILSLEEPKLQKMPENAEIPSGLIEAHKKYLAEKEAQTKAIGANENIAKIKQEKEAEIEEKKGILLGLDEQIATLKSDISDYFSNLRGVVEKEFAGKIKIEVVLLEYVITRQEYKDAFKIIADGKVFPHECNGALQNNVKLQILGTLQRLKGYEGITIMDNAEANTTQEVDASGTRLVLAKATKSDKLTIF